MKPFDSELQSLSEVYQHLGEELACSQKKDPAGTNLSNGGQMLADCELLLRIEDTRIRVVHLAGEWEKLKQRLDPASRRGTQRIAEAVRKRAVEVTEVVARRVAELELRRAQLGRELDEIQKGERYLASVKPVKNNYPKFVDSLG